MWWVAGTALWLVGAWALALLLGAVVHRSRCTAGASARTSSARTSAARSSSTRSSAARPSAVPASAGRTGPVPVPAPRSAPPATPPSGMRSQGYLSCAAAARPRP